MASKSELQFDTKKFGKFVGVPTELKDVDNTKFTEYVQKHRDELIKFGANLPGMDKHKAEDLVNDTWVSYKKNEENNKCYSSDGGHGPYIFVEEAVKARMKRMAKRMDTQKKEYMYLKNTSSSQVICAHFTDDTDDDTLQTLLTRSAKKTSIEIDTLSVDLKDSMMYFIACTQDCRISGLTILERLDDIVGMVENQQFSATNASYISDLWTRGADVKNAFREILTSYSRDNKTYLHTLSIVKEELEECKQMLDKHYMEAVVM